jgi:hypothetical protein
MIGRKREIFMNGYSYEELSALMLECVLDNQSIQALTDRVHAYTKLPILVVDPVFRPIAMAYELPARNPAWDALKQQGTYPMDMVLGKIYPNVYMDLLSEHEHAFFYDGPLCNGAPQGTYTLRVNGSIVGSIGLLISDDWSVQALLQVTELFGNVVSMMLRKNLALTTQGRESLLSMAAAEIFERETISPVLMKDSRMQQLVTMNPPYCICVLKSSSRDREFLRRMMNGRRNIIPQKTETELRFLFTDIGSAEAISEKRRLLESLIRECSVSAGCSEVFSDLSERSDHLRQAQLAAQTAKGHTGRLISFEESYTEILLTEFLRTQNSRQLYPEELTKLLQYDEKNHQEYFHTLEQYLESMNDLAAAAAKLYIHRNTVQYRIRNIQALLGVNPDEPETALRLRLGFRLYRLQNG